MANIRRKKTTNWLLIRPCIRFIWSERVQIANIISLSMVFLKTYIHISLYRSRFKWNYYWISLLLIVWHFNCRTDTYTNPFAYQFIRIWSKYSPYASFNTQHQIIATVICYLCACFDWQLYIYTFTHSNYIKRRWQKFIN